MPEHRYTPAEYALKRDVESFGNSVFDLAEHYLTHTYAVVLHFCQLENVEYLVLRYLNTGALPFDEFSKEWLHGRQVQSSSILQTVSGTVSI